MAEIVLNKNKYKYVALTIHEAARIASYLGRDGHSIYNIDFVDHVGGVDKKKVADRWNIVHHSHSSDPKYMINNNPDIKMQGVYSLDVLEGMCNDFGLPRESFFGRGRRASAAYDALFNHAKANDVPWPVWDDEGREVGVAYPVSGYTGQIGNPRNSNAEPE